jgi:hypothetical protein
MEPFTAITLLVAQYGIQQIVVALTGNQQMAALAGELFREMSASEDRLSSHLMRIEEQLDRLLAQPYETALGAGVRGLLDVVATTNSKARRKDLRQARQRFRDAAAAAQSQLQRAVAERYLLLCALALDNQDTAKTALGLLNHATTTAALEVSDTTRDARRIAEHYLEERGEAKGFGRERRLTDRVEEIRQGASEAAPLVANLLSEAGVLGQALGQTQPPSISTKSPGGAFHKTDAMWHVVRNAPGPVRFGTFIVTWDRFEPSGPVQRTPTLGIGTNIYPQIYKRGTAPVYRPGTSGVSSSGYTRYTKDIRVDVKIEVDPPLSRPVPLGLGWGSVRTPAGFNVPTGQYNVFRGYRYPRLTHTLPASARLYHLKENVSTWVNSDGKIIEPVMIFIDAFDVY